MDVANLGAKKTLVVTDPNIAKLPAFTNTVQSLDASGVTFDTYTDVVVEPTDKSYQHLIDFARAGNYDCYVAVGGGSVMDSAKCIAVVAAQVMPHLQEVRVPPLRRQQ